MVYIPSASLTLDQDAPYQTGLVLSDQTRSVYHVGYPEASILPSEDAIITANHDINIVSQISHGTNKHASI
jgi:hypothetical protein